MTTTRSLSLLCAAALLCLASPARAQRNDFARYDDRESRIDHRGLYAAIGGGGVLQMVTSLDTDANTFGYDLEGRLGYSFNSRFQLYLSGSYGAASHNQGAFNLTLTQVNVMVNLNNAFYSDRNVTVYGRIGLGIGVVGGSTDDPTLVVVSTKGLGEIFGFGVDIRLSPEFSLAPEIFYRRTAESTDSTVASLGLALNLVYY